MSKLWTWIIGIVKKWRIKTVSKWAARNVKLPGETTMLAGRWRNKTASYQAEVMDALMQPGIRKIVIAGASMTGKTAVIHNMMMYLIAKKPAPMMYLLPTQGIAEEYSRRRVRALFELCGAVKEKVEATGSDRNRQMIVFHEGFLQVMGVTMPSHWMGRPYKYLFMEDIDRYPGIIGNVGDPVNIAEGKTHLFYDKKIVASGTPGRKEYRLESEYLRGTQEHWHKRCPKCRKYVDIKWSQIHFNYEVIEKGRYRITGVKWECPHCEGMSSERDVKRAKGKWVAKRPDVLGIRSFWFNGLLSPWNKWDVLAKRFLEAMGDEEKMRFFFDSVIGTSIGE